MPTPTLFCPQSDRACIVADDRLGREPDSGWELREMQDQVGYRQRALRRILRVIRRPPPLTVVSECFLEAAHHKYRLAVARTKDATPETILVAYTGSPASQYTTQLRLTPS